MKKALLCVAALVLCMPSLTFSAYSATVGVISFTNITEESPTGDGVLYGAPTVAGSSLVFLPSAYIATSSNGQGDDTTGILRMDIEVPDGMAIQKIKITERGLFQVTGSGTTATYAQASGYLQLTEFGTSNSFTNNLAFSPKSQFFTSDESGSWSGVTEISLAGKHINKVSFLFSNTLAARSETNESGGTSAWINKQIIGDKATAEIDVIVPEPATILVLAVGGLGFGISRRRNKS